MGAMVARPPSSVLAELCGCVGLGRRFDFSFVPHCVLSYIQLAISALE
jgi:hypothetical protein